jgi:hypothetical protein
VSVTGISAFIMGDKPSPSISTSIDSKQTDRLIEKIWTAVSPVSLEAWLQGPGHQHFEDEIVNRFAYQGDRQTGQWPDLSEATQNIRSQQGFGSDWPVNIRTEEMFSTLTHDADFFMGEGSAEMNLPGDVSSGVAKKIKTAQEGSNNNPIPGFGPTPPRPVLAADEGDLAALLVSLNGWIIAAVAGLGGIF